MSEPAELVKDTAAWVRDDLAPPLLWSAGVVAAVMTLVAAAKKLWRSVNAAVEMVELLRTIDGRLDRMERAMRLHGIRIEEG